MKEMGIIATDYIIKNIKRSMYLVRLIVIIEVSQSSYNS